MKKLLSLLSVLTISGTAVPTTIAASPYQKEKNIKNSDINYQQINHRVKRGNENVLRVKGKVFGHDWLYAKISNITWINIQFLHNNQSTSEFRNSLISILYGFPKSNESFAGGGEWDEMSATDISIIAEVIVEHFDNIDNVYKNKNNPNLGIIIRTNRKSYWLDNDTEGFWGANINNLGDSKNGIKYDDRGEW